MNPESLKAPLVAVLLAALLVLVGVSTGAVELPQQDASTEAQPTPTTTPDAPDGGDQADQDSNTTQHDDSPTASDIVSEFRSRTDTLDTVVMTVETNITTNQSENFSTERTVWVDYGANRSRTERNSEYGETITVRNETHVVTYDVEENTVSRIDSSSFQFQTDVDRLNKLLNGSNATLEGRERIGEHETYRLSLERNITGHGPVKSVRVTLWLDADTYFPRQAQSVASNDNYSFETIRRYRNVSLNEPLSDDRFTIDIPADAEESASSEFNMTNYESLSNLKANATLEVPSPTLPDNYSFDSGSIVENDGETTLSLQYSGSEKETLSVSRRSGERYNYTDSEEFEAVDVGDRTGWYNELDNTDASVSMLAWDCGETRYIVSGTVTRTESIDIAESIECTDG